MMPKRFDTHFYIAEAPSDQVLAHDGHESVDSVWINRRTSRLTLQPAPAR